MERIRNAQVEANVYQFLPFVTVVSDKRQLTVTNWDPMSPSCITAVKWRIMRKRFSRRCRSPMNMARKPCLIYRKPSSSVSEWLRWATRSILEPA